MVRKPKRKATEQLVTIVIYRETKRELDSIGQRGESYAKIIKRLVEFYLKHARGG